MSAAEKPKPVHKDAVGVRGKFEADPETGWHTFFIDVDGWQHPLKLSTKKPELIDLAKAVGKQTATWGYLESEGNPNPHGGFYKNRWLDSVAPLGLDQPEAGIAEQAAAPHPAEDPAAPPPPVDWDAKERRIVRQACLKAAVTWCVALEHVIEDATVTEVAARFEMWVYRTVEYAKPEDLVPEYVDPEDIPFG